MKAHEKRKYHKTPTELRNRKLVDLKAGKNYSGYGPLSRPEALEKIRQYMADLSEPANKGPNGFITSISKSDDLGNIFITIPKKGIDHILRGQPEVVEVALRPGPKAEYTYEYVEKHLQPANLNSVKAVSANDETVFEVPEEAPKYESRAPSPIKEQTEEERKPPVTPGKPLLTGSKSEPKEGSSSEEEEIPVGQSPKPKYRGPMNERLEEAESKLPKEVLSELRAFKNSVNNQYHIPEKEISNATKEEVKRAIKEGYDVFKTQSGVGSVDTPFRIYAELMRITEKGDLEPEATAEISLTAEEILKGGIPNKEDMIKLVKALTSAKIRKRMKTRAKTKHEILEQLEAMQKKTGLN